MSVEPDDATTGCIVGLLFPGRQSLYGALMLIINHITWCHSKE